MSINLRSVRSVSPSKNLIKKIVTILVSITVFTCSFIVILDANKDAKETIAVLKIIYEDGIPTKTFITEKMIGQYDLIKKEYKEGEMFLANEIDQVVGNYAAYYLRYDTILYKDQLVSEKAKKNEWLYEMDEELEVITIPYNYLECGGDILTPGDRIRVRAVYEVDAPSDDKNENLYYSKEKIQKVDTVFDSIVVKDLLNSNSHSIYEVYKEVMRLPEDKKKDIMTSKEFIQNIKPKALILEGTREQIDTYAEMMEKEGSKSFLFTILSRKGNNIILDELQTLQSEMETWGNKSKNSTN